MLMDVEHLLFDDGNTGSVDFERYTKMAMRNLPDNPFFLSRNWNIAENVVFLIKKRL